MKLYRVFSESKTNESNRIHGIPDVSFIVAKDEKTVETYLDKAKIKIFRIHLEGECHVLQ